jgi:hypothetical protein
VGGGLVLDRPLSGSENVARSGVWVVCRHGLLDIKGLAVRVRFDPERRPQPMALTAVNRRGRELRLEIHNPLKGGGGLSDPSNRAIALHRVSVAVRARPLCAKQYSVEHDSAVTLAVPRWGIVHHARDYRPT